VLEEGIGRTNIVSVLLRCLYKATRNGVADLVPLLALSLVPKDALRWEEDVYSDGSWRKRGGMSRLRISFILKCGTGEMLALLGIGKFVIKRTRA
jgi:hypothetical protein